MRLETPSPKRLKNPKQPQCLETPSTKRRGATVAQFAGAPTLLPLGMSTRLFIYIYIYIYVYMKMICDFVRSKVCIWSSYVSDSQVGAELGSTPTASEASQSTLSCSSASLRVLHACSNGWKSE